MKKVAWYKRKAFWRRILIYAVVLVIGGIVVRWRWQVKQERQAEQVRTEEKRLVNELVRHYSGVKRVKFYGAYYNLATGFTDYVFRVNDQTSYSNYTVGYTNDVPEIGYYSDFFDKNERKKPLSITEAKVIRVKVIYNGKYTKE
ncbi:MAG: hypothetical protein LKJ69_06830 [Lactobacillus sp.]|nr:hypothetical protein [Lactobacillus sp.]